MPHPKPDFSKASDARAQLHARLLGEIEAVERNMDLVEAVSRSDWAAANALTAKGASPLWRDMAALNVFAGLGNLEAAQQAERMAGGDATMAALPLIAAAEQGDLKAIDYILSKNPPEKIVTLAFCAALKAGKDDASDRFYAYGQPKDMAEPVLVEMLLHRPALYKQAAAARAAPPDYILHFMKACEAKDALAMHRALDAMTMNRGTLGPNIERHKSEFEIGMGHQEALMTLIQSGQLPAMARYYEKFTDLCPTNVEMFMVIAMAVAPPDIDPLPAIVEKFKPDAARADFAFSYAAQLGRMDSVKYLAKTFPELVEKNMKSLWSAAIMQKTPDAFNDLVAAGYKLPAKTGDKADLLSDSLVSGNGVAATHIESKITFTPAAVLRLQAHHDVRVLKRAAETGNDWHFRDDILFWRALEQGDRAAMGTVPADKRISTASLHLIEPALKAAIARGDFDLVETALQRGGWTAAAREIAFHSCLAAPEALSKFDFAASAPHILTAEELKVIAGGASGEKVLTLLESKGFSAPPAAAFTAAIEANAVPLIEHLFGKGADLPALAPVVSSTVNAFASRDTIAVIKKWAARGCDISAPGLETEIESAAASDLFKGPDCPAIRAAYAGFFPAVLKKALGAGAFDPAALASARDAHGNSVLDILGAHGKLNEILLPELWAGRDAAAFIRDNTAPRYEAQCDFGALQAGIRQLRLKSTGRDKRLGFKGP